MNKTDVHAQVVATGEPYRLIVSTLHGAVLPDSLDGLVVLDCGAMLPKPAVTHPTDDGLRSTLSFAGVPFHCYLPWSCVHAIGNPQWTVTWALGAPVAVPTANKSELRLVR